MSNDKYILRPVFFCLSLMNILTPLNATLRHMKYCGNSRNIFIYYQICPFSSFSKPLVCRPTCPLHQTLEKSSFSCQPASPREPPDQVNSVSTLNQIYLTFHLQHEQQRIVRISSDKIQKYYKWGEEMASCITEISHDYDFPLPAVPPPQSNEQWHRTCGYSKGLEGHACLTLVRVRGPHLITSVWEFGRLILTDLRVGHLLTSWPMKPETMGNTTRVPTCRYNNHSSL